jgi:hypothetical protein
MANTEHLGHMTMNHLSKICPICTSQAQMLDVVDFNQSCIEFTGGKLPLSGKPLYYHFCDECGFCFCPEMHGWTPQMFEEFVYNQQYIEVDPDYVKTRPENHSRMLHSTFKSIPGHFKHLDYGGGSGLLANLMTGFGWGSISFDPFVDRDVQLASLGKFHLISAFEVFEHVPDIDALMNQLSTLMEDDGLIMFSTLISDGHIDPKKRLSWWYAAPRNGHISLFSKKSLALTAKKHQFNFGSFSNGLHVFFKQVPVWASHLFKRESL